MHLMQKVEQFFFPCSKILRAVREQHAITLHEFDYQVKNFTRIIEKPETCDVISAAFCEPNKQKERRRHPRCL